jgi:hypothetical protein
MSATRPADHWLDRLAARHTRRNVLKTALAGALTLPLLRSFRAKADSPTACQKGCFWTSHQVYDIETSPCFVRANGKFDAALVLYPLTFGLTFTSIFTAPAKTFMRCLDNAVLNMKQNQAQCLQPNCPGFNPNGTGGPCETCTATCCTFAGTDSGYYCCTIVAGQAPCWCTAGATGG